jgi:hypothetical protein
MKGAANIRSNLVALSARVYSLAIRKWGVSNYFFWEGIGVVAPETSLESEKINGDNVSRGTKRSSSWNIPEQEEKCSPDTYLSRKDAAQDRGCGVVVAHLILGLAPRTVPG